MKFSDQPALNCMYCISSHGALLSSGTHGAGAARGVPAMRNTMRYTPCDGNWPWQLDARKARRGESQLDKRFGSGFWPSQFLQVQAMGAIELSNSRLFGRP
jgi:hypothetical protein